MQLAGRDQALGMIEDAVAAVAAPKGTSVDDIDATSSSGLLPPLVRAAVAAGRIAAAERWGGADRDHAARAGLPASATRARRGRIEIQLAAAEADAAAELAASGIDMAGDDGLRPRP